MRFASQYHNAVLCLVTSFQDDIINMPKTRYQLIKSENQSINTYDLDDDSECPMDYETSLLPNFCPYVRCPNGTKHA